MSYILSLLYDIKNILAMQLDNNSNKIKAFRIIS